MSAPPVEAVIINYKRPANVARIVRRLREQSVPCKITVVDNHPQPEFALESNLPIDRLVTLQPNHLPFSRYLPSFGYQCDFTYFHDDDMLPGRRVLEHFLNWTHPLGNFGVLGQDGRLTPDGEYNYQPIKVDNAPVRVDIVIRAYFLRTVNLIHLFKMIWELPWEMRQQPIREDDLALCTGLALFGKLKHYVIPATLPDTRINEEELQDIHALSQSDAHLDLRSQFLKTAQKLGWRAMFQPPPSSAGW